MLKNSEVPIRSAELAVLSDKFEFPTKNAVLSKECGKKWGCAAVTPIANRRSIAIQLARSNLGRSSKIAFLRFMRKNKCSADREYTY